MKKPNPPKLVTIAVTTTIATVFWIFFTLYQLLTTVQEPSVDIKLLEPIIPNLDSKSLQEINNRVFIEEGSFVMNSKTALPSQEPESPTPTVEEDPTVEQ